MRRIKSWWSALLSSPMVMAMSVIASTLRHQIKARTWSHEQATLSVEVVGNQTTYRQREDTMMRKQMWSALGIMWFVACSLAAQEKPGTIAALEFQKPKKGMVP